MATSKKIKCCECKKEDAVWLYMPGHSDGNDFFCDKCVPRGCSCNVYSLKEFPLHGKNDGNYIFWNAEIEQHTNKQTDNSFYWEPVDDKGRRFPCCEYDYSEEGFYESDFEMDKDVLI